MLEAEYNEKLTPCSLMFQVVSQVHSLLETHTVDSLQYNGSRTM